MPCVALFEKDEMFYGAKLVSFKDNFHVEVGNDLFAIGDFRITFGLFFKASAGAYPFI